jgi:DNA-binding CsgD family transcriptional regulator
VLARCLVERGDLDAAEAVLTEVEPLLPNADAMGVNAQYLGARGALRFARGEAQPALEDFIAAGEILSSYGYVNPAAVPWRTPAAVAAHALGDGDRAARLIDEELRLAREFELPAHAGAALRVRAIVAGHDVATLDEAIVVLDGAGAPLELARALIDLGGAHRRAGRRVAAREPLRSALELAHRCGATMLERRAHDELLATGARPRRAMLTGIESLTPSERRIADLVAAGNTNRAVAETLFLTKGTVEWHLKHIYQKVDVRSRDELAAVLGEAAGGS